MRRVSPRVLPLVMFGAVLLLSLFGAGAGLASFLLLRAGYGFLVWGLLPFLALVLAALVLITFVLRAAGGRLPGVGRSGGPEEKRRDDPRARGSRGGDDV
jgi:hypothetical protein